MRPSPDTTLDGTTHGDAGPPPWGLRLGVLWHRDPARIGAWSWTPWSRPGDVLDLSRQAPIFSDGAPLDDRHISRSPLQLVATPTGVMCWPTRDGQKFELEKLAGEAGAAVSRAALTRGVRLGLGRGALVQVVWGPPPVVGEPPDGPVKIAVQVIESARAAMAQRGRTWPETGDSPWLGREVMERVLDTPWPQTDVLRATITRLVEIHLDQDSCGLPAPLLADLARVQPEAGPAGASVGSGSGSRSTPQSSIHLRFLVSRDEEHVALTVTWGAQTLTVEARAHTYTLLTLARARLADEQAGGLSPEERGWVSRDTLCRQLRLDPNLLLTHLFRARRQLTAAGVPGGDALFERRLDAGQLRIGTANIEVIQG